MKTKIIFKTFKKRGKAPRKSGTKKRLDMTDLYRRYMREQYGWIPF